MPLHFAVKLLEVENTTKIGEIFRTLKLTVTYCALLFRFFVNLVKFFKIFLKIPADLALMCSQVLKNFNIALSAFEVRKLRILSWFFMCQLSLLY